MSMTAKYYTSLNKIPELCEGRFTVEKIKSKFGMTENKLQKMGKVAEFIYPCSLMISLRDDCKCYAEVIWVEIIFKVFLPRAFSLQCFDTVGWATGRASGL